MLMQRWFSQRGHNANGGWSLPFCCLQHKGDAVRLACARSREDGKGQVSGLRQASSRGAELQGQHGRQDTMTVNDAQLPFSVVPDPSPCEE